MIDYKEFIKACIDTDRNIKSLEEALEEQNKIIKKFSKILREKDIFVIRDNFDSAQELINQVEVEDEDTY